jgi:nitric oxide reductase NorD protein
MAELALAYVARTRRQSDQLASVHFADTEVDYRDDNRHLWRFHEEATTRRCSTTVAATRRA